MSEDGIENGGSPEDSEASPAEVVLSESERIKKETDAKVAKYEALVEGVDFRGDTIADLDKPYELAGEIDQGLLDWINAKIEEGGDGVVSEYNFAEAVPGSEAYRIAVDKAINLALGITAILRRGEDLLSKWNSYDDSLVPIGREEHLMEKFINEQSRLAGELKDGVDLKNEIEREVDINKERLSSLKERVDLLDADYINFGEGVEIQSKIDEISDAISGDEDNEILLNQKVQFLEEIIEKRKEFIHLLNDSDVIFKNKKIDDTLEKRRLSLVELNEWSQLQIDIIKLFLEKGIRIPDHEDVNKYRSNNVSDAEKRRLADEIENKLKASDGNITPEIAQLMNQQSAFGSERIREIDGKLTELLLDSGGRVTDEIRRLIVDRENYVGGFEEITNAGNYDQGEALKDEDFKETILAPAQEEIEDLEIVQAINNSFFRKLAPFRRKRTREALRRKGMYRGIPESATAKLEEANQELELLRNELEGTSMDPNRFRTQYVEFLEEKERNLLILDKMNKRKWYNLRRLYTPKEEVDAMQAEETTKEGAGQALINVRKKLAEARRSFDIVGSKSGSEAVASAEAETDFEDIKDFLGELGGEVSDDRREEILDSVVAKYFTYSDVDLPEQARRDRAEHDANPEMVARDRERAAALLIGARLHSVERLESVVSDMQEKAVEQLALFGLNSSKFGLSKTWAVWDIAKQIFYATHPKEVDPKYTIADPFVSAEKYQEIIDRHVGWEIWFNILTVDGAMDAFTNSLPDGADQDKVDEILDYALERDDRLSSKELAEMGALARSLKS